jgi:hypothetical protein
MPTDWVEVHNCAWLHEALFLGSVLESEGIENLIPDQYTAGVQPFYVPALGGIRILVHAEDVDRARELLASPAILEDATLHDPEPGSSS